MKPHKAGRTKRWHTNQHLEQTVADHHGQCVGLLLRLYPAANGRFPSYSLIYEMAHHDLGEAIVGDMPGPAKEMYPKIAKAVRKAEKDVRKDMGVPCRPLTDHEARWLHFIDKFEAYIFAHEIDYDMDSETAREGLVEESEALGCFEVMMDEAWG